MSGRPEGNLIDAVQYVSNAITALRDFDDPDRNGTATLWLCRALIRLQKDLPATSVATEDRNQLVAARAILENVLARLQKRGRCIVAQHR